MENNPEYNKSKVKIKIEYEVNKPLRNLEKRTKCLLMEVLYMVQQSVVIRV